MSGGAVKWKLKISETLNKSHNFSQTTHKNTRKQWEILWGFLWYGFESSQTYTLGSVRLCVTRGHQFLTLAAIITDTWNFWKRGRWDHFVSLSQAARFVNLSTQKLYNFVQQVLVALYIWSFCQCDSWFCRNTPLFMVYDQSNFSVSMSYIQY